MPRKCYFRIVKQALLAALLAACGLQAWLALAAPVGLFNDDALHILLARSVAHGAFALPGGPPRTDPLPGFALLLALPARLAAPHWGRLRWLCLAAGWAAVWLSWRLARRVMSGTAALTAAFLVALNPVLMENAGVVRPDVPFLAVSLAVLELLAGGGFWVPALLAALASMLRPQGALLLAAVGLALWVRRGRKLALGFLAAACLPLAVWTARNILAAGTATDYAYSWAARAALLRGPAALARHLARVVFALFGRGLLALPKPHWLLPLAGGLAALVPAVRGGLRLARDRSQAWALAAAFYAAGVLALHLTWSVADPRYLIPLLPLAWIFLLVGTRTLWERRRAAGLVLTAALAVLALRQDWAVLKDRRGWPQELWPETMAWIRSETPPEARFQTMFTASLALLAGRPAEEPPLVFNRDSWLAYCLERRIGFVHLDREVQRWGTLPPERFSVLASLPGWARSTPYAREVYRNPAEGGAIFRISHPDPRRFLQAWALYGGALRAWSAGAGLDAVRPRLREAAAGEPRLALPWAVLGHLAADPKEKARCLARAVELDPTLEAAREELRRAEAVSGAP